jgi:hypothetical protein
VHQYQIKIEGLCRVGYEVVLLRNPLTVRNSKLARYLDFPLASLLCRRAVQSALVHCATQQLPCQSQYKCLSPLCHTSTTLSVPIQMSQSTVPHSNYPVSPNTNVSVHCASYQLPCQSQYKCLSPLQYRLMSSFNLSQAISLSI